MNGATSCRPPDYPIWTGDPPPDTPCRVGTPVSSIPNVFEQMGVDPISKLAAAINRLAAAIEKAERSNES